MASSDTTEVEHREAPPWFCWELPGTGDLLRDVNLAVPGHMFLEIFSGCSVLTLCCLCSCLPVVRPWDIAFDETCDVLAHGWVIFQLVSAGVITWLHLWMPCQSFTRARQSQLRSWAWPKGIPDLSGWRRELVDAGNSLLAWTILLMSCAKEKGCYACLEPMAMLDFNAASGGEIVV